MQTTAEQETFEGENLHIFHSTSATHESSLHEILSIIQIGLEFCKNFIRIMLNSYQSVKVFFPLQFLAIWYIKLHLCFQYILGMSPL